MAKLVQGIFKPQNPDRYKGDVSNIIYRSSYELKLMMELDRDPRVVKWSSEDVIIPYKSPLDGRYHRYFMDFYVMKSNNGIMEETLIEVKPNHQLRVPQNTKGKKTKTYLREVATYAVNQAKWEAAEKYAKKHGWSFIILDEYKLGIKK